MFPFLIDFVLKSKLDVAAADLSSIDKQQWHFLWRKRLLSDNVVQNRLRFVITFGPEPESLAWYVSLDPASVTLPAALGDIRLLISLGFPQECS